MSPRRADILVVDDDAATVMLLGRMLADVGTVRFATHGSDALRVARLSTPDLVLLDGEMPGMNGLEVCAAMKADPQLAEIPVIFVTGRREEAFEVRGFEVGAVDLITKPVNPVILLARVRAQLRAKRMSDELREHATSDVLTGVANRRRFDQALEIEWLRAQRRRDPLSLLFLDVDHFKLFNDHYGHPAGDACLAAVATALVSACQRPADLVARYGGEEFMMLLPSTGIAGAEQVARRVLGALELLKLPHEPSPVAERVTLSGGIACLQPHSRDLSPGESRSLEGSAACDGATALVEAADRALYEAKAAGRARVHSAGGAPITSADPPSEGRDPALLRSA